MSKYYQRFCPMLYISGKFTENQLEKQWEFSRDYSITSHRWLHHHQKNRRRQIRRIHRLRKNLLQRSHRRHRIRQKNIPPGNILRPLRESVTSSSSYLPPPPLPPWFMTIITMIMMKIRIRKEEELPLFLPELFLGFKFPLNSFHNSGSTSVYTIIPLSLFERRCNKIIQYLFGCRCCNVLLYYRPCCMDIVRSSVAIRKTTPLLTPFCPIFHFSP